MALSLVLGHYSLSFSAQGRNQGRSVCPSPKTAAAGLVGPQTIYDPDAPLNGARKLSFRWSRFHAQALQSATHRIIAILRHNEGYPMKY